MGCAGLPVLLAIFLMVNKSVVFYLCLWTGENVLSMVQVLIYHLFTALMWFTYYKSCTLSANGRRTKQTGNLSPQLVCFENPPPTPHSDQFDQESSSRKTRKKEEKNSFVRWCEKCDQEKQPNVHHCSVCRECIWYMDHHCPWTNNCVGLFNKKFFVLFLLYTSCSCLTMACFTVSIVFSGQSGVKSFTSNTTALYTSIFWILAIVIGVVLLLFFIFHVFLLVRGQSTLDFLSGRRLGEANTWQGNVSVYFGECSCLWLVPIYPSFGHSKNVTRFDETEETEQLVV